MREQGRFFLGQKGENMAAKAEIMQSFRQVVQEVQRAESYRTILQNAGVTEPALSSTVEKFSATNNPLPMPMDENGQLPKMSGKALRIVTKAAELGIDPTPTLKKAAEVATSQHRKKVGMFGAVANAFSSLTSEVQAREFKIFAANNKKYGSNT